MIRVTAMLLGAALMTPVVAQTTDPAAKAREEIWAKEMSIYAGRAKGSVDYYVANASDQFLAWTYGTPKPFRKDSLAAGGQRMAGRDKEKITTEFRDFSLHENGTAIIYYVNHRTVMPDGTAVEQTFDNIHVWARENGDWKVLASMSRLQP